MEKCKVILVQLGSPQSPKVSDVRRFLKEFLADPRVVDLNPLLWKIILYLFVLPFRPKKTSELYQRIWDGKSFPLIENTRKFYEKVKEKLAPGIELNYAFLLSKPRVGEILNDWAKENPGTRATELLVLPQFPQYSESTIASGVDFLGQDFKQQVNIPSYTVLSNYHRARCFIDESVKKIEEHFRAYPFDDLILSFHGIPKRRVLEKKDVYYQHCSETFFLIKERITWLPKNRIHLSFQSRFGSEEWLTPYTTDMAHNLAEKKGKIAVYCPSFVVDCLETLDEIGHELRQEVASRGAELKLIPCLNDDESWANAYAHFINTTVNGSKAEKSELYYPINTKEVLMETPEQSSNSKPLSAEAKSILKIMFVTLFLDLVGFSIIFPMFPAMAKHYLEVDADNTFLKLIFMPVNMLTDIDTETVHQSVFTPIVLFGSILGALYSMLQFIGAPLWGTLSDRIGRRPVLIISIIGLAFSYFLWFFSGSFTTLVLARIIGGVMGGNISTASAVVADITEKENRSKGMAFIGIAFALGFIIGPALGGILSLIDLTKIMPSLSVVGVNPFSMPALFACLLSLFNLYMILKKFPETLPPEKRGTTELDRSANLFKLFKPFPYPGVNLTNYGYFVFIAAFSGMEFTLTFLAFERLGFTPLQNGYMFIFIGFVIAMIQGGFVRRKAHTIGEKNVALAGLMILVPGLILISLAKTTGMLYFGLFFLAIGSACAIPCLTSLTSLYSPSEHQGKVLGVFRSLGALGRVIGPLFAGLIYWRFGASTPYVFGAVAMLIPIMMLRKLPALAKG